MKDALCIKKLLAAGIGGLLYWLALSHIVLAPKMAGLAGLYAASLFATLLFESRPANPLTGVAKYDAPAQFLVLTGVLTLIASRQFGMVGLLVMAPAALVCSSGGLAAAAGLYWCVRSIFQAYEQDFNSNVTGINIMHLYVSAALYAGFALVLVASANWMRRFEAWHNAQTFLSIAILLPPSCNYFMHEESTSGFLVAMLTAAVVLVPLGPAVFAPLLSRTPLTVLMLLPGMAIVSSYLCNFLFGKGNAASLQDRLQVAMFLGGIAVAALIITLAVSTYRQRGSESERNLAS